MALAYYGDYLFSDSLCQIFKAILSAPSSVKAYTTMFMTLSWAERSSCCIRVKHHLKFHIGFTKINLAVSVSPDIAFGRPGLSAVMFCLSDTGALLLKAHWLET